MGMSALSLGALAIFDVPHLLARVHANVFRQRAALRKARAAHRALVRAVVLMEAPVDVQIARLRKGPAANIAQVWLAARVHAARVLFEASFQCKRGATRFANVRPLDGM